MNTQPMNAGEMMELIRLLVEQHNKMCDAIVAAAGNGNTLAAGVNTAGTYELAKIELMPVGIPARPRFPLK